MALPLVICGPSGSGKSTLLKKLMDEYPDRFAFSVSHTTRKPRPGELHGIHYYFVERPDMEKAIAKGEFIETAEFSGNLYGTSKRAIEDVQSTGKICVLDIDIQGVKSIKASTLKARYFFIKPPSMDDLKERLENRQTETAESLQKRLDRAHQEMSYADKPGFFDVIVTNDDLASAYERFKSEVFADE